jgi:hypothetical protein
MSTPLHESNLPDGHEETPKQDTIFYDVADMSGYDKNLRTARTYLYIVAALEIIRGICSYFKYRILMATMRRCLLAGLTLGLD